MKQDAKQLQALEKKYADILERNTYLEIENNVWENYISYQHTNGKFPLDDEKLEIENEKLKSTATSRPIKRTKPQITLTLDQKNDICSIQVELTQKEMKEMKKNSERLIDTLRAVLEETDIRIAELKKEAYEFKRDIVVGAENFRTGKTIAEKFLRYVEEKLRQKDALIEKLRLKNSTLKVQVQKLDAQLRHKEEMGDTLHYIDFHQLQIENKQYLVKIEERNEELLKLKQTTGKTVQILNQLKKRLNDLLEENIALQNAIQSRVILNEKVLEEIINVTTQNTKASKICHILETQHTSDSDKQLPKILDYVSQKAKMYELQQEVKKYERKIEIAEKGLKYTSTT